MPGTVGTSTYATEGSEELPRRRTDLSRRAISEAIYYIVSLCFLLSRFNTTLTMKTTVIAAITLLSSVSLTSAFVVSRERTVTTVLQARGKKSTEDDENKSKIDPAKRAALDGVLNQIERSYGRGSIVKLGDADNMIVESISSGALTLDAALGGGFPKGRVVEIYGPESSGKTTLALHAIAECQKAGGTAAFVDAEHALDPVYGTLFGLICRGTVSRPGELN